MKKNYFALLLVLGFGLFFSTNLQAQLIANNDQVTVTRSNSVQIVIQNVLGNDTLNSIPVTLSQVNLTQISASSNISLEPNGSVVLNAGSPSGLYTIFYEICQTSNPGNCSYAEVYVQVNSVPVIPVAESVTISTGLIAPQIILENVLSNDTYGGIPITVSEVTINQVSSTASPYFTINPATANIVLIGSPPPGTYPLTYFYCVNSDPNNCVTSTVNITVVNSLSTAITATYQDFNSDGITNVGDVINYTYSITNLGSIAVSNISITSSEVNINGGPPIPLLNPSANNNSTYTGIHAITQADINSGSVIVSVQTNGTRSGNPISITTTNTRSLNIANGIKLNAFIDYNSNGTQQNGEPSVNYGSFQYELNNNGIIFNITSSDGMYYLYETNPANSYDLGYTIDPQFAAQYTVTPAAYPNVTVANGSGVVTYNFALSALNPYNDLGVYLFSSAPPRPGFIHNNSITYVNNGNQTIASGTITYTHDNNVSITTYPSGATPTATGFTYSFTNLFPGQSASLTVSLQVPTIPTVQLGDWVTNTATITIPANDINTSNNTSTETRIIVGSYDPNDKAESHGPQVLFSSFTSNDYLTYTIRFENTGTAEAINILVEDVLDTKLDETSVKMVASSHAYVLEREGRNLTWRFNGVNLEPSIPGNPIIGHGYIVFQVKPKPGYVIGDVIANTANIYFDFNPAIVTNTWTSTFVPVLGTSDFIFDNFRLYPNPVKNNLTLSNTSTIDTVEILSVLGQRVQSVKVNALQTEIDMSGLTRGMYFVKVTSNGQEKTVKILKE